MIRFIATKHDEYRRREFDQGDIVIDPWRYIPDQPGVKVRRLGENKPEKISLLVPTRTRAGDFTDMVRSAFTNATYERRLEVIAYLDNDDPGDVFYPRTMREYVDVTYLQGPRILLSKAWNECYRHARGEILMHCGDDIRFKTPGWDQIVREAFRSVPDRIVLVHGDDCSPNTDVLATHGFLHRRWVEQVGYFLPPYFSCDWNDVWLTEVADMIGRRVKVPIVTEHLHYTFDKRERDTTDLEREERGREDNVVEIYKSKERERRNDAAKLKEAIA